MASKTQETQENPITALVARRLGSRALQKPTEIAAACDVSLSVVYAWIDAGEVVAVRSSSCWQVLADSVVEMYRRKAAI